MKKSNEETILLQVRGHFFTSVETVLNSLQLHSEASLPFVETLAYEKATLRPPAYVTPQITRFNLSHLVKADIIPSYHPHLSFFFDYRNIFLTGIVLSHNLRQCL